MKKALLIALFGLMFVGLASFTNGTQPEATSENNTSINNPVNDSKEFAYAKAILKKYEDLFKKATSCDEMEEILIQMGNEEEIDFDDDEKMTEEEYAEFEKLTLNLMLVVQQKVEEFGCE